MLACVPLIWGVAFALASPMAIWKRLENWTEMDSILGILGATSNTR